MIEETIVEYRPRTIKGRWTQYSCGNCGFCGLKVIHTYCPNCGRKIFWDSPVCLTKDASEYEDQQRERIRRKISTNDEYIRTMPRRELADFLEKIAKGKIVRSWYAWLTAEREPEKPKKERRK